VTLKTLVTGVAAVAVVAAAAGGVTSIASSASPTTPAIQPVVFGVPMPLDPAPELSSPLAQTLNVLAGPGSFGNSGNKQAYIQGGLGRITAIGADAKYRDAQSKGYFPLNISVADVDENGPTATANVTATLANGAVKGPMPMTFVQGPSSTGWQLTQQSVADLSAVLG
jgi:hypothetical protein